MSGPDWGEWQRQMKGLHPPSPLDQKARDLAVAYFEIEPRTMTNAAEWLGLDRGTVTRRLQRAHELGWVSLGSPPAPLGRWTSPRVCRRLVFWTDDYWSAFPEWDGEGEPPF